ncbi:hypothetical protein [Bacillus paranthracis]|uniref:hypothetical protein n=1 Tax=Bacillus paranthracis TaxID=2026186 RepID=UPI0001A107FB|nr:hypothetical protein bcere0029_59890 [Bacillus cereus AH1272]EEL90201.1 hypothetical protein bcere0030_58760 [Bacillus cereus AH1273]
MDFFVSKFSFEEVIAMYEEQKTKRLLGKDEEFNEGDRIEMEVYSYNEPIRFIVKYYKKDCDKEWYKCWLTCFGGKDYDKKFIYSEIWSHQGEFKEIIPFDGDSIVIETNLDVILKKTRENNRNDINIEEKINKRLFEMEWQTLFEAKKYEEIFVLLKDGYEKGYISIEEYEESVKETKEIRLEELFK